MKMDKEYFDRAKETAEVTKAIRDGALEIKTNSGDPESINKAIDAIKIAAGMSPFTAGWAIGNIFEKSAIDNIVDNGVRAIRDRQSSIDKAINEAIGENGAQINGKFNKSVAWRPRKDPLTLDLDGDGIETIAPSTTNPIYFDHDVDGIKSSTGWISADDGFLVMDRNGNGTIDDGTELFGDATPVVDPWSGITHKAADGFAALDAQDTNVDGKVDSSDANWSQLRVWRDLNQDGVSQANELFTLDALGIGSIKVAKTANSQTLTNGNQIADLGSYTKTDGSQGTLGEVNKMADVNLIEDTFHSVFTDQIPLADGVTDLPEMLGSGKVRDLHQAASQSTELKDLLSQFSQAATRQDERAILDQLLGAWADTSGMYKTLQEHVNPNHDPMGFVVSYQQFGNVKMSDYENQVGSVSSVGPEWQPIVDAWEKKLHILEAFNGRYFFNLPNDSVPGGIGGAGISSSGGGGGGGGIAAAIQLTVEFSQQQIDLLNQSYDALKESVYTALLLQTRFKPLFDKVSLQIDSNGIKLDYSSLEQEFRNRIASNPAQGLTDLIEFNRYAGNMLGEGWYGNEFAAEIIDSLDDTTVLQPVYADLGVGLSDKNKGTTEQDYIYGGTGDDNIASNAGNDVVFGDLGNDSLDGGSGDDQLLGGAGDDSLTGSYGDDTIVGGTGNDLLYGGYNAFNNGYGNDTYRFSVGDGVDTISDSDSTTGNTDTIEFTNVTSAALRGVERQGYNLVIKYGTADQITVLNYFSGIANLIEKIKFSDGETWGGAQIRAAAVVNGTAGNDTIATSYPDGIKIYGFEGNDSITGTGSSDL
ncbi:MAG TPA: calcium-binding protein, partial [Noviherbaspirillum sp.]